MAEVGDWVVGTGGVGHESAGHRRLIYAMRVTRKIPLSRYVSSPSYAGRADRFPNDAAAQGRFVLISDDFWYFGRNAVDIGGIPTRYLEHPLEKRGPGYRRDFPEAFIADFERWIGTTYSRGIHGEPCGPRPPHWSLEHIRCRSRRCA
jgi:hypothetical protein